MRARPAATAAALSRPLARGAQVRNLSSCVKVALDFVSPENARRCVTLTNQFAKLPRGHHLSEDKLQVKTMLLHAMEHIAGALLPQHGASAGPSGRADVEAAEAAARALGEAMAEEAAAMLPGSEGAEMEVEVEVEVETRPGAPAGVKVEMPPADGAAAPAPTAAEPDARVVARSPGAQAAALALLAHTHDQSV